MINLNRCKKGFSTKLSYLYRMFHNNYKDKTKVWNLDYPTYVRSYDGEKIRLHKIDDVVCSGKKRCIRLVFDDKELVCTPEHKIMTYRGWVRADRLKTGSKIMIDTLKPCRNKKISFKLPDTYINVPRHPFRNKQNRIEVHRLIYEAYINGLKFIDYLDILWNDDITDLKFIDPSIYHIHHIDNNHYNNDINNLQMLHAEKHKIYHGETENFRNFNQGEPRFQKLLRIENIEKEIMTYDIICSEPYHNFIANGIVVHNSGKTACEVRNLLYNPARRPTYSNIQTKGIRNNIILNPNMILKKEIVGQKRKRSGEIEDVYKLKLNKEFWSNVPKPINILLDEAHTLLNPRRAMSKVNILMSDFLSLIRRMLGSNDAGEGEAIFITQLPRRLDPILKDMANEVRHHICHYNKVCNRCNFKITENSDSAGQLWTCPRCNKGYFKKYNHVIEILFFSSISDYNIFIETGQRTYYNRVFIKNIHKVFKHYNTLQWDNLFSEFY